MDALDKYVAERSAKSPEFAQFVQNEHIKAMMPEIGRAMRMVACQNRAKEMRLRPTLWQRFWDRVPFFLMDGAAWLSRGVWDREKTDWDREDGCRTSGSSDTCTWVGWEQPSDGWKPGRYV